MKLINIFIKQSIMKPIPFITHTLFMEQLI